MSNKILVGHLGKRTSNECWWSTPSSQDVSSLLREGEAVLCMFNGLCLNSHNKLISMVSIKWNTLYIVCHTCMCTVTKDVKKQLANFQKAQTWETLDYNTYPTQTWWASMTSYFGWYVMRQKYIGRIQTIPGNCWLFMCGKFLIEI